MLSGGRLALLVVLWASSVGFGVTRLWSADGRPGVAADPPHQWPSASSLGRVHGQPTFILMAHPRCPCTAAALEELNRLLANSGSKATYYVVFFKPVATADNWDRTPLWRAAEGLPGVTVVRDEARREADRFGVSTSGQALLYDEDGRLVFSGGITAARGHAGDNAGLSTVATWLLQRKLLARDNPVYGCSLREGTRPCKTYR